jgi:hypothetical protein
VQLPSLLLQTRELQKRLWRGRDPTTLRDVRVPQPSRQTLSSQHFSRSSSVRGAPMPMTFITSPNSCLCISCLGQ